jgi:ferredoxin, 2Fe-2S
MESNKSEIIFLLMPERSVVRASHGDTVLEACLKGNIEINHSCGGMGTCGTCRVQVQGMSLDQVSRNEIEQEMAQSRQFAENERLACQIAPCDGLTIQLLGEKP